MKHPVLRLLLLATLIAPRARAASPETWLPGDAIDLQVRVEGRPAPLRVLAGRDSLVFLAADSGCTYSLVLRNRTSNPVAAAVAVDGLNVLNGQRSTNSCNDALYILDPRGRVEIRGWRISTRRIRCFVFADDTVSYAHLMDREGIAMGTIEVLVFARRADSLWIREPWAPFDRHEHRWPSGRPQFGLGIQAGAVSALPSLSTGSRSPEPAPSQPPAVPGAEPPRPAAAPQFASARAGTGWGPERPDPATRVDFPCVPRPLDRLVIRYEYRESLLARGAAVIRRGTLEKVSLPPLGFSTPPPVHRHEGVR